MKKTIVIIIILACLFLTSCSQIKDTANSDNKTNLNVGVDSISDKGDEILNNNEVISNIDSQLDYETNNQGDDVGGTGGCKVHSIGYHFYPIAYINYVGQEEFDAWMNEMRKNYVFSETECVNPTSTFYEFIKYFNVPKEAVIDIYNSDLRQYYLYDINIDLLYEGTSEENDQYYRDVFNDYLGRYKKMNFFSLKSVMIQRNRDVMNEYLGEEANNDNVSIIEVIYRSGITREQMEANIAEANSMMSSVNGVNAYDYDLDSVYNERGRMEELIKEHSAFYMDLLFCGLEPSELPYE